MTGVEFCDLTAKVRDHLLAGERAPLERLLAGQNIESSRVVLGQIAFARAVCSDETVPAKILSSIAGAPTSKQARIEMRTLRYLDDFRSPKA